MDGIEKKYTTLIYPSKGNITFDYEAMLDYKIDNRINKYEERIDDLDKKVNFLLKKDNISLWKKQNLKEQNMISLNLDKIEAAIDEMDGNDDIRIQIQCVTRMIKQLDILRKNDFISSKKRKMMAFFRSVLKINSDQEIFSEEQLEEFRNTIAIFRYDDIECNNFTVMIEKSLRKVGLRTMVAWE